MRLGIAAGVALLLVTVACGGSSNKSNTAPTVNIATAVSSTAASPPAGGTISASPSPAANASRGTPGLVSTAAVRLTTPVDQATPQAAATPSGPAKEAPEDALKRQLNDESKKNYGAEWDELHPGQQALVPRAKYVECSMAAQLPPIQDVQINGVGQVAIDVEGVPQKTAAEVTATLTVLQDGKPTQGQQTFDEVQVGNEWRWIMDSDTVDQYKAGNCPS